MPTPSNRQLNWVGVTLGATTLTGITSVAFNNDGKLVKLSADNDRYVTLAALSMTDVTISVESIDPASIMSIANGTTGAFTATNKDAKGVTGGDILFTLAGAVVESTKMSGSHGAASTASLSLTSVSPDGQTNPLSFTRA